MPQRTRRSSYWLPGGANRLHPVNCNAKRAGLVADVTGVRVASLSDRSLKPPRFAEDATGAPEAIAGHMAALAPGRAIALVEIGSRSLKFEPALLVEREIALIGCHTAGRELARAGVLPANLGPRIGRVIKAEIGLADVPAAYVRHPLRQVGGIKTTILPGVGAA